jgi:hypothetical protein
LTEHLERLMGLVTAVDGYGDTNHTRATTKSTGVLLAAAALAAAPTAQADGDASYLDRLVAQVYNQVQRGWFPRTPPQFQRIVWDQTGLIGGGGTGPIVDANPALGGPFSAW